MTKRSILAWLAVSSIGIAPIPAKATANDDVTSGSHSAVKVLNFRTGHSGYSEAQFVDNTATLKFCTGTPVPLFRISRAHPSHEQISKALTAAFLAGKQLSVSFENVGGTCYVKSVQMS